MFRRRTSSSGKIHYRINIDKIMCPNPVDIYNKKIEVIRIGGQIVSKDQQYEYNVLLGTTSKGTLTYLYDSGVHCDLADTELYGHRITKVPSNYAKGKVATFILHGRLYPAWQAPSLRAIPSRSFWIPYTHMFDLMSKFSTFDTKVQLCL